MNSSVDFNINKELGECYLFMGEYSKAKEYYQKALSCDAKQPDPFMGLAAISLAQQDLQDAYALYSKANFLDSTDNSLAGMAMLELEFGKHVEAFDHFCEALEKNPANMVAIKGIVQLGYVLNKLEAVVPLLRNALSTEAGNAEAVRYTLAGCLTALGDKAEAKEELEIILGANPANNEAQQLYALFAA